MAVAGKLKVVVESNQISFEQVSICELAGGGDVNSTEVTLRYEEGLGNTFLQDQILYSEGTSGNQDFFEIKSKDDVTCTQDGTMQVIVSIQIIQSAGNTVTFSPTIAGSPNFVFTVDII